MAMVEVKGETVEWGARAEVRVENGFQNGDVFPTCEGPRAMGVMSNSVGGLFEAACTGGAGQRCLLKQGTDEGQVKREGEVQVQGRGPKRTQMQRGNDRVRTWIACGDSCKVSFQVYLTCCPYSYLE
jgi:hypothetical protein